MLVLYGGHLVGIPSGMPAFLACLCRFLIPALCPLFNEGRENPPYEEISMPGNNPSQSSPATPAIIYLNRAIDNASLGMHCMTDVLCIFRAMRDLSKNNEVLHGLALTAIKMADDHFNMFDAER